MSESDQKRDTLADVNSATLGTTMPVVTLPDGTKIQTGTVGALIVNIRTYDEIVSQDNVDQAKKNEVEEKLRTSMPVLKKAGIFDLFTPEEWTRGSSPGRKFVGELATKEDL